MKKKKETVKAKENYSLRITLEDALCVDLARSFALFLHFNCGKYKEAERSAPLFFPPALTGARVELALTIARVSL